MSSAVAKLSKPVMRGMHVNEIKRNIAGAALVGFFSFLSWDGDSFCEGYDYDYCECHV